MISNCINQYNAQWFTATQHSHKMISFSQKVIQRNIIFHSSLSVSLLGPSLADRHSGKHTLLRTYITMTHNDSVSQVAQVHTVRTVLRRAVHCRVWPVEGDSRIKQELSLRMKPIHLAGTQSPLGVTSPNPTRTVSGPGESNSPSLGHSAQFTIIQLFVPAVQNMQARSFGRANVIELSNPLQSLVWLNLACIMFLVSAWTCRDFLIFFWRRTT